MIEEDEVAHSVKANPQLERFLLLEVSSQLKSTQEAQFSEFMDQYISASVNRNNDVEDEVGLDEDHFVAVAVESVAMRQ